MLQLYGNPRSLATRCLWMLEEMGRPYQLIEKSTAADDLQTADYLLLNPNARIPTLVDGDVVIWESMAISRRSMMGRCVAAPQKCWVWLPNGAFGRCWKWNNYCFICCSIVPSYPNFPAILLTRSATSCSCKSRSEC